MPAKKLTTPKYQLDASERFTQKMKDEGNKRLVTWVPEEYHQSFLDLAAETREKVRLEKLEKEGKIIKTNTKKIKLKIK